MKKRSKDNKRDTCCPLTSSPRLRLATDAQTSAIKENFPAGIAKPALRALVAAGFTTIEQLNGVSEQELAEMHGIGPSAIRKLRAGLIEMGLSFRS